MTAVKNKKPKSRANGPEGLIIPTKTSNSSNYKNLPINPLFPIHEALTENGGLVYKPLIHIKRHDYKMITLEKNCNHFDSHSRVQVFFTG